MQQDPNVTRIVSPDMDTYRAVGRLLSVSNTSVSSSNRTMLTHMVGMLRAKTKVKVIELGAEIDPLD